MKIFLWGKFDRREKKKKLKKTMTAMSALQPNRKASESLDPMSQTGDEALIFRYYGESAGNSMKLTSSMLFTT